MQEQDLLNSLAPPFTTWEHPLGTDQLGRDTLSRTLYGIRISIFVGFGITAISLFFGGLLGLVAGYYRGWLDTVISAVIDVFWGFPLILVAVLLVGALGPGLLALMLAVAIINWAGFARIMRGEVLSLREREFVEAARALGIGNIKIMWRHILPHAVPGVSRARLVLHRARDHLRGGILVHRDRRPAAAAEPRLDDRRGPKLHACRLVADDHSGRHDRAARDRPEPSRRRAPRIFDPRLKDE